MIRLIKILPFFFFGILFAQEQAVHSVYFKFDKYDLDDIQGAEAVNFIKNADSTRIESIQIYGYTDDRGKDAYNYKLSNNRANMLKDILVLNGIKNKIIVTIEGKGRILIEDDVIDNLPEVRSKNRRVDLVLNLKPLPKIEIPGVFTTIQKKHVVGDRIYLEALLFNRGSHKLTPKSRVALEKMATLLLKYKNIEFEVQGHICCTPSYHKESIDIDTRKRELSIKRAEEVYNYFAKKKIAKSRMSFKGYGNTMPLGKGPDYDRRVELVITKI
ncbi:MAG: OmpA family protein [Flavobacterium sp.]